MADRVAEASDGHLTSDEAHKILHGSAVWRGVVGVLVRRLAVLNSPQVLVAALLSFDREKPVANNNRSRQENVEDRLGWLGRLAPVVDFSTYPMEKLYKCAPQGVSNHRNTKKVLSLQGAVAFAFVYEVIFFFRLVCLDGFGEGYSAVVEEGPFAEHLGGVVAG